MILSLLFSLVVSAQANITVERDLEHGVAKDEECLTGACGKQVNADVLTNNRAKQRQAIANIMSESTGSSVSYSNTDGAAVREN